MPTIGEFLNAAHISGGHEFGLDDVFRVREQPGLGRKGRASKRSMQLMQWLDEWQQSSQPFVSDYVQGRWSPEERNVVNVVTRLFASKQLPEYPVRQGMPEKAGQLLHTFEGVSLAALLSYLLYSKPMRLFKACAGEWAVVGSDRWQDMVDARQPRAVGVQTDVAVVPDAIFTMEEIERGANQSRTGVSASAEPSLGLDASIEAAWGLQAGEKLTSKCMQLANKLTWTLYIQKDVEVSSRNQAYDKALTSLVKLQLERMYVRIYSLYLELKRFAAAYGTSRAAQFRTATRFVNALVQAGSTTALAVLNQVFNLETLSFPLPAMEDLIMQLKRELDFNHRAAILVAYAVVKGVHVADANGLRPYTVPPEVDTFFDMNTELAKQIEGSRKSKEMSPFIVKQKKRYFFVEYARGHESDASLPSIDETYNAVKAFSRDRNQQQQVDDVLFETLVHHPEVVDDSVLGPEMDAGPMASASSSPEVDAGPVAFASVSAPEPSVPTGPEPSVPAGPDSPVRSTNPLTRSFSETEKAMMVEAGKLVKVIKMKPESIGFTSHLMSVNNFNQYRPGQWFHDDAIDMFLNLVIARSRRTPSLPIVNGLRTSFVGEWYRFKAYEDTKVRHNHILKLVTRQEASGRTFGARLLESDILFFPMNLDNNHWILIVVTLNKTGNTVTASFQYIDSLANKAERRERVEDIRVLIEAACENADQQYRWVRTEQWSPVPQQTNGYDCGVFVCAAMESIASGSRPDYSMENMLTIRKRIAFYSLLRYLPTRNEIMDDAFIVGRIEEASHASLTKPVSEARPPLDDAEAQSLALYRKRMAEAEQILRTEPDFPAYEEPLPLLFEDVLAQQISAFPANDAFPANEWEWEPVPETAPQGVKELLKLEQNLLTQEAKLQRDLQIFQRQLKQETEYEMQQEYQAKIASTAEKLQAKETQRVNIQSILELSRQQPGTGIAAAEAALAALSPRKSPSPRKTPSPHKSPSPRKSPSPSQRLLKEQQLMERIRQQSEQQRQKNQQNVPWWQKEFERERLAQEELERLNADELNVFGVAPVQSVSASLEKAVKERQELEAVEKARQELEAAEKERQELEAVEHWQDMLYAKVDEQMERERRARSAEQRRLALEKAARREQEARRAERRWLEEEKRKLKERLGDELDDKTLDQHLSFTKYYNALYRNLSSTENYNAKQHEQLHRAEMQRMKQADDQAERMKKEALLRDRQIRKEREAFDRRIQAQIAKDAQEAAKRREAELRADQERAAAAVSRSSKWIADALAAQAIEEKKAVEAALVPDPAPQRKSAEAVENFFAGMPLDLSEISDDPFEPINESSEFSESLQQLEEYANDLGLPGVEVARQPVAQSQAPRRSKEKSAAPPRRQQSVQTRRPSRETRASAAAQPPGFFARLASTGEGRGKAKTVGRRERVDYAALQKGVKKTKSSMRGGLIPPPPPLPQVAFFRAIPSPPPLPQF